MRIKQVKKSAIVMAIIETVLMLFLWTIAFQIIESAIYTTYWNTKGILLQWFSVLPIGICLLVMYLIWWGWKQTSEYRIQHKPQYERWKRAICAVRLMPVAAILFVCLIFWIEWRLSYVILVIAMSICVMAVGALASTLLSYLIQVIRDMFGKAKNDRRTFRNCYSFWCWSLEGALFLVVVFALICGLHRESYDSYIPENGEIHAMVISYKYESFFEKEEKFFLKKTPDLQEVDSMSEELKEQMLQVVETAVEQRDEGPVVIYDGELYVTYCLQDESIITRRYYLDDLDAVEEVEELMEQFWDTEEYQEIINVKHF